MSKITKFMDVRMGCDPELFIRNDSGSVIGSEMVVGKGVETDYGRIVPDGVQVELNPHAQYCRESLNFCIAGMLKKLASAGFSLDFSQSIELNKNEFELMPAKCKQFGCKPSYNVNSKEPSVMLLDPSKYLVRSAGGHIHLGASDEEGVKLLQSVNRLIPVLDTILGNLFVLIDRDKGNIERRKYYGRAGEYRLPKYGVEYRTLSNFWLLSPMLASLAFGLARHAVQIVYNGLDDELMKLVDYQNVVKTINENDYTLAKQNWDQIKAFLVSTTERDDDDVSSYFPIDSYNLAEVDRFLTGEMPFSKDIIKNWTEYGLEGTPRGFNNFVTGEYENE